MAAQTVTAEMLDKLTYQAERERGAAKLWQVLVVIWALVTVVLSRSGVMTVPLLVVVLVLTACLVGGWVVHLRRLKELERQLNDAIAQAEAYSD
ncbi:MULTISPECIES: hypothetical protein [unclassified Actinomyces]|uniref:hypothetical protein n=1 Tax=unclassified Actinomyces TaxID=2609248 RepID=UPI0013A6D6F3|nr:MULTISPECIES: hypothetical protein [unclassified Actinomyces]MBW3069668.1 hypothetical protein [Actinomyces sp. 594]NDR54440.1 hypothetical protein [Actinomyces sp. 565]